MRHKFRYKWSFSDTEFTKDKGKVFSTFSCGGGSTMGYKLAGFDVIGNLEFDERKNAAYVANHHPRYSYCEDIRDFRKRDDLPEELYHLDILDGSPPCKSFSIAGSREETWGVEVEKYGHTQVWDDLFFELVALADKLKPKVVIAENVKGLLLGEAVKYVSRIYDAFERAGYYCQHFLLDASKMGVPQKRERVFFICLRKDIAEPFLSTKDLFTVAPSISMDFAERPIPYGEFADYEGDAITQPKLLKYYKDRKHGDVAVSDAVERNGDKRAFFNQQYLYEENVSYTLTAHRDSIVPFNHPHWLSRQETCSIATFPQDYDFNGTPFWEMCGRAVPPVMMAHISSNVYDQWLSKIK